MSSRRPLLRAPLVFSALALSGCLQTHEERVVVRRDPEDLIRKRAAARLSYAEFLDARKLEAQTLEWDLGLPTAREQARADASGSATDQPAERLWPAVPQYAIRESLRDDEARHEAIQGLLDSIKEDPWRDYEQERRDTLYRDWGDRLTNHPPTGIEPDTDGPPGWLGPKVAPELPALPQPGSSDEDAESEE